MYREKEELPVWDETLSSRRLYDRMVSQAHYFWDKMDDIEREMFIKLGINNEKRLVSNESEK